MKTMIKNNSMLKAMEMAEIFKVEMVDGVKCVNRFGFYADQRDGTCAVYKPEIPVCHVDEFFGIEEDGPGDIEIVNTNEIVSFLNEIGKEIEGIPAHEVSLFTPCGWYYDTIV